MAGRSLFTKDTELIDTARDNAVAKSYAYAPETIIKAYALGLFPMAKSYDSTDIQFFDPSFKVPEATKLLASIMGTKRGLFNQYRNNRVKTNGNSSIGEIDKWIREANSTSKNSTNLIYRLF